MTNSCTINAVVRKNYNLKFMGKSKHYLLYLFIFAKRRIMNKLKSWYFQSVSIRILLCISYYYGRARYCMPSRCDAKFYSRFQANPRFRLQPWPCQFLFQCARLRVTLVRTRRIFGGKKWKKWLFKDFRYLQSNDAIAKVVLRDVDLFFG